MKRLKTLFKVTMSLFLVVIFMGVNITKVFSATTTYNFNNLTFKSSYGLTYSINSGVLTVNFQGQYKEVKFDLPSTINLANCSKITINALSETGKTAFKFYDTSGNEVLVNWNCMGTGNQNYSITSSVASTIKTIGIMSQDNVNYTTKVNSINFEMNSNDTIKGSYAGTFNKMGSAVTLNQLKDTNTLNFIKKHYNSITMENEMKPDALLGSTPKLITVTEAKNKGYIIPDNYLGDYVPEINFTNVDEVLKIAYDNALSVRFHTLIWHSQTPSWFFKYGYDSNYAYCDKGTMDKRIEYYVKNVMAHVYSSSYGSVVYAWDIANEYFHNTDAGVCHWTQIYGEEGNSPSYVKNAFKYANDMLNYYNKRSSVKLFYNDYNTYMITDKIIALTSFINSSSKLCDGVGLQSHLDVAWPSVDYVGEDIQKYLNAGLEVQITELDVTVNTDKYTLTDQANYYYNLMKMLATKKRAGGNISGITFWGLYDSASWRASGKPLLFSDMNTPKESFYSVIKAASN